MNMTDISSFAESLYVEYNIHKECTGTAYVRMANSSQQKALMDKNCKIAAQTVQVGHNRFSLSYR